MNMSQLDTRFIPPFLVPVRFFLTAPFFAVLGACLLFWQPDAITLSRWTPLTLAFVHLITLGVLLMNMTGAVMQVLPVLHGKAFPAINWLPRLLHLILIAGVLGLTAGFTFGLSELLILGGGLLGLSLLLFSCSLLYIIGKPWQAGTSAQGIALATVLLLLTLFSGLWLLQGYLPSGHWISKEVTQLHLTLGIKGWCLLLIFAVAQQVIPMFHVTPDFPKSFVCIWPWVYFSVLCLYIISTLFNLAEISLILQVLELCLSSFSALLILYLIQQRKRKIPDTTRSCWQIGWSSLLLGNMLMLLQPIWPEAYLYLWHWWLGVCWLAGFVLTIISGMLLKIMPFLSYLHLQQQAGMNMQAMMLVPNMHQLIDQKHSRYCFYLWCSCLVLLLLAPLASILAQLIALVLAISFIFSAWLLFRCWQNYSNYQQKIAQEINASEDL